MSMRVNFWDDVPKGTIRIADVKSESVYDYLPKLGEKQVSYEAFYMSLPKIAMKWDFDSEGTWTAKSVAHEMNLPFEWKIVVLEDGKFSFEESERELVTGLHFSHFDTFAQCKEFCEIEEAFLWKEVYFEYEDRLDEKLPGYPYEAMYRHSRVIDGVRMFPSLKYKGDREP